MNETLSLWDTIWNWVKDPGITIIAIIAFGWIGRHFGSIAIGQVIRRIIRSTQYNQLTSEDVVKRQDTLISLFVVIWQALIIVLMSFLVFKELFPRVDLTPVFASAGIIGIALGFGAQSIIKDFLTGVFIIVENQYRVGDVVDIEGASGTVERLTIRSTILRDGDGNVHFLPNGTVSHVINKTMGYSRVNFSLTVDPETNIDSLAEIINKVGEKMAEDKAWADKILEAPHFVSIGAFNDIVLEVKITAKTQPSAQWGVTGELRKRLLKSLNKNNIDLAHIPIGPSAPAAKK